MSRLCLVIPHLGVGGMQRVLTELGEYFTGKPATEVHMILYSINREIFYPVHPAIIMHKPEFTFNRHLRFWYTLKTIYFLRKEIKAINPISVLSFGEYWNSFVLVSLYGLNYPLYISDRCKPDKRYSFFHRFLRNRLYPRATGIITQTSIAKEIYTDQFRHPNITVIGNPIRNINVNGISKEKIVLSIGRLIPTKHHSLLIDIFVKISRPDWKLVIIGGNAPGNDILGLLQDKIEAGRLNDRVILTGNISHVEEYYAKSSIFAFTSSSEGFPNVIGEAMSAGLPVISFDCVAGPSELIDDEKTGFLVPLFDSDQFGQKLERLMDDAELRLKMGNEARMKINSFSIDKIGNQFFTILDKKIMAS